MQKPWPYVVLFTAGTPPSLSPMASLVFFFFLPKLASWMPQHQHACSCYATWPKMRRMNQRRNAASSCVSRFLCCVSSCPLVAPHRDVSGLTFMFVRSLKDAIYGQVWSALQVSSRVLSQSPAAAVYHISLRHAGRHGLRSVV